MRVVYHRDDAPLPFVTKPRQHCRATPAGPWWAAVPSVSTALFSTILSRFTLAQPLLKALFIRSLVWRSTAMLLRHSCCVFGLIILLALALASASGCVFTDPINMPPTIQIVLVPATERISRGGAAQFGAEVTDDQSQTPTVEWAWTPGMCPPVPTDHSQWPADRRR